MTARISVVIPSYNHAAFLEKAIESVVIQAVQNLELIVVDDGSGDDSVNMLKSLQAEHGFKLICQENRGAHQAINRAIKESSGDYLSILNSDDIYHEGRLVTLLETAKARNASFIYSGLDFIDASDKTISHHRRALDYEKITGLSANARGPAQFLPGNPAITTSNFFFSRDLWNSVGKFRNLRYTHDWDWALRATLFTDPQRIDLPMLSYRVHGSNTLAEGDIWRHISENAFIFASHLKRHGLEKSLSNGANVSEENFALLLANDSFLPVPTLYFLGMIKNAEDEVDLLTEMADGQLVKRIKDMAQTENLPLDLFLSSQHIRAFLPFKNLRISGGSSSVKRLQRKVASWMRNMATGIDNL